MNKTIIKDKIWLSSPHMGVLEKEYVEEAFATNWIAPLGPNVNGFEEDIESYLSSEMKVAVLSSGTAAIHIGLKLLGVGQGDEVLCQSFTFSASANPIMYLGAKPVFIDSEKDTWNISPELLEEAIKDRLQKNKKPKAIVAVHLYGMPYKVEAIKKIADYYNIPVLEDSAEALGSSYHGVKCGSFGDVSIFSFNGNKIITTSGGGALLSKNKAIVDKAIFLSTQARDEAPHYQHSEVGYNYRMSNVLAGIGRGQIRVLDDRVKARRNNHEHYVAELNGITEIEFLKEADGFFSNRWLTCILTPSFSTREEIRRVLNEANIESRPLWKPMHKQPIFESYRAFLDGTSEDLFKRGLCLPSGSNLNKNDLFQITNRIKDLLQ